jgi:hypothetical protein
MIYSKLTTSVMYIYIGMYYILCTIYIYYIFVIEI